MNRESKSTNIDLSRILADPDPAENRPRRNSQARNDLPAVQSLDDWLLGEALPAIEAGASIELSHAIRPTDRTVGARLAGEIARRFGDKGLPPGSIRVHLEGSAGVSFGAFCIDGLHLILSGEANDYVGKGMAGGEIIVRLPPGAHYASHLNTILGNTCLYGATAGALFAAGQAGERFAVRNSGAVAVVEGVGDHGCEYMTGGMVVVLGATGRNLCAGMTGGCAFVYDEEGRLSLRLNDELVKMQRVAVEADAMTLYQLIQRHARATDSERSLDIIAHWPERLQLFWQITPR